MGKHTLTSEDEDEDVVQQQDYLVEVITKARVLNPKNKQFEYRVKWHDYASDDDTWEPQENVAECERLLKSFWKNVGKQYRKHPGLPGTEYSATKEWISKERRHFKEEVKRERAEREAKERERRKKVKVAKPSKETDAPTQSRSVKPADSLHLFDDDVTSLSSDDTPLRDQAKKNKGKEKDVSSGVGKTPSLKIRLPAPSVASTNKFSGMKITKKPTGSSLLNPLYSPSTSTIVPLKPKPNPPVTTAASTSITVQPRQAQASTRDDDRSNQFLPPRPSASTSVTHAVPAHPAKPTPAPDEAVDNFLTTMMSFGESEAQKPENLALQPKEQPKTTVAIPTGLKFTKKWSWSGELFIDNADAADRLCEITIHDTKETSDIGFRLGAILDNKDSLRFSKTYTRSELNVLGAGLRKVDQFAKIGHRRDEDEVPLTILKKYLIRRNLTISCAGISGLGHVAEMIAFPSAGKELCERLHVPLPYRSADCLLVALMPWHIPPSKYGLKYLRSDELRDSKMEREIEEMRREFATLAFRPNIETALRILGFDSSFVKFLPLRKYCVWSYQVDAKPTEKGRKFSKIRPETKALFDVLSFFKAENIGYESTDARIIFMHVGSVRNIWKLPGIVQRRCDKPEVQFITYGTHEGVEPSMWGIHEIYPLGGIVTFTTTALLENPFYAAELIEQIHRHPLWECYILPSVLAVFVRLSCPGEDPVSVYTREPYHFGRILDLIKEGKVALMQSPGLFPGIRPNDDVAERDKWIGDQFTTLGKTPLQLLEEFWAIFVTEYSNKTEAELKSALESEIVQDLAHLQTQQAIRESYRRFVVIKAIQDEHISLSKDGFEWRTANEFVFGDDFLIHSVELERRTDQPLAA